ncbi:head maturation protease, ClpP-related [Halothermothrix orenii]|uniref:ATP-dependent Clp protease proteolytic subunit n=1 Tax=Halothermothrix orenii (strain H 168 / OCM 544 / DSM 9562) TaxID=373903 RepID=B8D1N4_HALOH|nr:head maturation protease, ClpP-related [Halothermothrix orenii]ACL69111.1 peptidase S14 ClpP [Halothermothrix orenii H 168]
MSKNTLFKVFNESDNNAAEIYLHGPIRNPLPDEDEEDVITLKEVRNKLNKITADKIIVHLNSTGGDLFQSVAIHNLFKDHKAEIIMINDGIAASGGSIILMAGDKIKFYPNSIMMIHAAHTITYGDAKYHREVARKLDKIDKSLKENYSQRFTGAEKELEKLIQEETWLTAKEAKEKGFCDEIISDNTEESRAENKSNNLFMNMKTNSNIKGKLMKKYGSRNNKSLLNKLGGNK